MLTAIGLPSDFSRNLRYLCSYYHSTSEICRRLGINRQQFNKYVSGLSRPSNRNMRLICDFFGVEEYEILAPFQQLKKIIEIKGVRNVDDAENVVVRQIEATLRAGQSEISPYFGFYFTYYYSFSRPGKILKSILHVFETDGVASYKRMERLIEKDSDRDASFVYKYAGVVMRFRDRLFMIDREALTGAEISQTVLYPSFKNRLDILTGLTLGTAGRTSREPICSRIVLEYLGMDTDLRSALGKCGLYGAGDAQVSAEIEKLIRNQIPPEEFSLRAIAQ